jgi:thioredoxin reductase/Pyruvate/2-oxoacid:ferredoxin oxidoreductase delta subunit
VAALVVVPYLVRFRRRVRADRERKREAQGLGIDKPAAQYPYVDPAHCIGCGACVAACPEGDVLGVVGGTAVVINGLRCVGHARCEAACPVGAIEVGLGDLKSRKDVPLLGPAYETSVPGVFVVGELGGLALVRNAVAQGREVVREIAGRIAAEGAGGGDPAVLDLAIVGAGPAGLSAALSASHAGLSYLVVEREPTLGGSLLHYPRRKMVLTQPVELPPWGALDREEYAKEALLELFEGMVRDLELAVRFGSPVSAVEREGDHLVLRTGGDAAGGAIRARCVVLALGRRGTPRKLGVPGEELPKVMYRLLDAESYRDRRILVVGGGDSAAEAAIGLGRQPGNRVTLSYRRDKIVRVKKKNQDALDHAFAAGSIEPLFSSRPVAIEPDRVRLEVEGSGEVELPNDEVFVFAGGVPPFDLLHGMGVAFGGPGRAESE